MSHAPLPEHVVVALQNTVHDAPYQYCEHVAQSGRAQYPSVGDCAHEHWCVVRSHAPLGFATRHSASVEQ